MEESKYLKANYLDGQIQRLNYGMQCLQFAKTPQDLVKFKEATGLHEFMPDLTDVVKTMQENIQSTIDGLQTQFDEL